MKRLYIQKIKRSIGDVDEEVFFAYFDRVNLDRKTLKGRKASVIGREKEMSEKENTEREERRGERKRRRKKKINSNIKNRKIRKKKNKSEKNKKE